MCLYYLKENEIRETDLFVAITIEIENFAGIILG